MTLLEFGRLINAWHRPLFQCASKRTRGGGPLTTRESHRGAGDGSKKKKVPIDRARRRSSSIVIEKTLGGKTVEDFSKKPSRLTVVGNAPNPPRKLGEAGESLWLRVQSEYRIEDVGGVELL